MRHRTKWLPVVIAYALKSGVWIWLDNLRKHIFNNDIIIFLWLGEIELSFP
jgi:hypothetical protein